MKQTIGNIDIEWNGLEPKYKMSFNKPNYTYQYLTIEELEAFWQELLAICHNYRRDEQIIKVSN
jgi:hypothetical protein